MTCCAGRKGNPTRIDRTRFWVANRHQQQRCQQAALHAPKHLLAAGLSTIIPTTAPHAQRPMRLPQGWVSTMTRMMMKIHRCHLGFAGNPNLVAGLVSQAAPVAKGHPRPDRRPQLNKHMKHRRAKRRRATIQLHKLRPSRRCISYKIVTRLWPLNPNTTFQP